MSCDGLEDTLWYRVLFRIKARMSVNSDIVQLLNINFWPLVPFLNSSNTSGRLEFQFVLNAGVWLFRCE